MSENIQIICTINNRTDQELKVQSAQLSWGKFYDKPNFKPVAIPAHKARGAFRSSGKRGSASGTEGIVVYQMGEDPQAVIRIYWDVPWASGAKNAIQTETFDEDVCADTSGWCGHGAVEAVTVTVTDRRVPAKP